MPPQKEAITAGKIAGIVIQQAFKNIAQSLKITLDPVIKVGKLLSAPFKAVSKVKKAGWKAMKGAMAAIHPAVDGILTVLEKLGVLKPILKVFDALLKMIGASVMKTVMPALKPFLDMLTSPVMLALMEDIGKIIGLMIIPVFEVLTTVLKVVAPIIKKITEFFLENKWALNLLLLVLAPGLGILKLLTENWDTIWKVLKGVGSFIKNVFVGVWNLLINGLKFVANGFIWFVNTIIGGINALMNFLTLGLWGDIPKIPYLHSGIDYVPRTQPYMLEKGEQVIAKGARGRGEIHVHIDLRNAVVDNVDRLSQRIAEQVLIQIG